jgi:biofilm PGA synthesis N-glycosyltransferase PgaC
LSFALARRTYMGVGRNLSYKKSLFFKNKGFASHSHVMSGDDDLFVNQTASAANTRVSLHPGSFTNSVARRTFGGWLQQKKRHMSTGKYYKGSDQFKLGTFYVSLFIFYAALAVLIITGFPWQIILGAWLVRLLVQMIIFGKCMKNLSEFDIIWIVPFFDVAVVFLYPAISISNLLIKDKTWK